MANEMIKVKTNTTLEAEIKKFADSLPYWSKFLAAKILSGSTIGECDSDISYSYLLEELKLLDEKDKPVISINYNANNLGNYKTNLHLSKLEAIEGVNALVENQIIEFSPNLTIIYGINGSGKSGYVRLLKKIFYSKAPEEILPNIHMTSAHKPIKAKVTFITDNYDVPFEYPTNENTAEFEQFSIFDGKGLFKQLAEKNEFEFRPAGLKFFSDFANAIATIEERLNAEIKSKKTGITIDDLSDLFEGESEIKTFVKNLSANTKIEELKKYTTYGEKNRIEKTNYQKQYDELLLASKGKEKEIQKLENIKKLLIENKNIIEGLNQYFSIEYLNKIHAAITDCINKDTIAKNEGVENFKTDKIEGIGTTEWKNFILAASAFANIQKFEISTYPDNNDNCLLCHQPLSEEARKLIDNYWLFIKSIAEENVKNAQEILDNEKEFFQKLNFDIFPEDNILTIWLNENYPKELILLKQSIINQKQLSLNIISDISNKQINKRKEIQIDIQEYSTIESFITDSIQMFKDNEQSKELERLLNAIVYLEHLEKFNIHFSKFDTWVNNQVWLKKAGKANFAKRQITDTEKVLSNKYFNQKYIDTFNEECIKLNGNFGIEVTHTGSGGKSYRQLKLKGKNPNVILSEGEQKVIAIADFIAEMKLSEINRGVVFDDPVTSLDEKRKSEIAERLVKESSHKQVIIFTHDLVFVSCLLTYGKDSQTHFFCHWIENRDNNPGQIWLNNSPSYEKEYRNAEVVKKHHLEAKKDNCSPQQREYLIKSGFTALRTCYEILVINDLFNNVVQRFNERVSVDALSNVYFNQEIVEELLDSFAQCCRYMEGHTHSDKYAYKKPEVQNLNEEIIRYEALKSKIKKIKKISHN